MTVSYPAFPESIKGGNAYPGTRTPMWSNLEQNAVSGRVGDYQQWVVPKWKYTVSYEVLRSDTTMAFQEIVGFYNIVKANNNIFTYVDPDDSTATAQIIGTGDGTTTNFQLIRVFGGFAEPVFYPTAQQIFIDGDTIPPNGFTNPAAPVLVDVTAGSLAGTTYYVKNSWVSKSGETHSGPEGTITVANNHKIRVTAPTSPPSTAIIGWNCYISNTATGGSLAETRQNVGGPIAIGTDFVLPNSGLIVGAPLPFETSGWALLDGGVIQFDGPPQTGAVVTWTGTFAWLCRFTQDSYDFNNFAYRFWALQSMEFETLLP